MKNLYACFFVLLFLAACASHVYDNTRVAPPVSPSPKKVA